MLEEEPPVRDAFLLARRRRPHRHPREPDARHRGPGPCFGKTGTLTGVSALSGYCDAGDRRLIAFSILQSGVTSAAPTSRRTASRR